MGTRRGKNVSAREVKGGEKRKLPLQYNATFCEQRGDFVRQLSLINQDILGPSLMRLFVDRDLTSYLKSTSKQKDAPIRNFLFEWVCWVIVIVHCLMMVTNGSMQEMVPW